MRYHCIHIHTEFAEEWQRDIFEQELFDMGFDTFDGDDAYIPSELWEANSIKIEQLFKQTHEADILHVEACPDENWNAVWEANHQIEQLPMGVRIIPHCAFGAGHHETTGMLIDCLMTCDLSGKTVLDNGCGTGILGIMAKKRGAEIVVAVDIDDKSVENTRENAALNDVEIDARLGDTPPAGTYDLILSNIHRNILIAQMPLYSQFLRDNGELWLSGFLLNDCEELCKSATKEGLKLIGQRSRGEWQMLQFKV